MFLSEAASLNAPDAPRPHYRVASFGLPDALQRVAQIVFEHARHNPFSYEVVQDSRLEACDVALIDMTVRGNERLLRVLRQRQGGQVVLTVGRRGAASRVTDDLLLAQFATRLLQVLNDAVARLTAVPEARTERVLQPARAQRRPATLDARLIWGRAPRALVLDTSTSARLQLMARLTAAGWDVQGAASLGQATAWLRNWPVELVISDWSLTDGEARRLLQRPLGEHLRGRRQSAEWQSGSAHSDTHEPHWVLLTHRPTWWQLLLARWSGCVAVLDKPATPQTLLGVVDRLLRERLT